MESTANEPQVAAATSSTNNAKKKKKKPVKKVSVGSAMKAVSQQIR
jgi:hypothetical protein